MIVLDAKVASRDADDGRHTPTAVVIDCSDAVIAPSDDRTCRGVELIGFRRRVTCRGRRVTDHATDLIGFTDAVTRLRPGVTCS